MCSYRTHRHFRARYVLALSLSQNKYSAYVKCFIQEPSRAHGASTATTGDSRAPGCMSWLHFLDTLCDVLQLPLPGFAAAQLDYNERAAPPAWKLSIYRELSWL